jgi:hypothetical protein
MTSAQSKSNKVDWSKAGKKAALTRKKNAAKRLHSERGKKAVNETIGPSERGFIKYLITTKKAKENEAFHHEGLPDIMVIAKSGKIQFFEIKPNKGSKKQCLLNPRQNLSIKNLLANKMVEGVSIVYYEKKGKKLIYPRQQEITLKNIDGFSFIEE